MKRCEMHMHDLCSVRRRQAQALIAGTLPAVLAAAGSELVAAGYSVDRMHCQSALGLCAHPAMNEGSHAGQSEQVVASLAVPECSDQGRQPQRMRVRRHSASNTHGRADRYYITAYLSLLWCKIKR